MLTRLSQGLCQTVLTTSILVCIWPPLQGSSHLGSYWIHFPPSQLQIPVSFANIDAHAKFIVLAKLLQISWSFTQASYKALAIKLHSASKCSCLAKGMEAPGTSSESLWEVQKPCWLPSQWAGARLPLNWLFTSQNKDKQSFKWLG